MFISKVCNRASVNDHYHCFQREQENDGLLLFHGEKGLKDFIRKIHKWIQLNKNRLRKGNRSHRNIVISALKLLF